MKHYRLVFTLFCLISVPVLALACLWDYDTLRQERARFPSTLELITGKFLRHSKEFYQWRINDRLAKLKIDPSNVSYYDDLAVAYEKTGQHAKAIETILAKDKLKPGLYETYSNLGTFHILAGDFELGLPYINKALAINPEAHFGRERYQKWLVEYAMSKKGDGKLQLPLNDYGFSLQGQPERSTSFEYYLNKQQGKKVATGDDHQKAVKGILGMMRFANHDNPLLLEVLGDLLLSHGNEGAIDAKRLAARAYLKASYSVDDKFAQEAYRELAKHALRFQTIHPNTDQALTLEVLEVDFKKQLTEAEKWYSELAIKEASWIREGKDADAEFDKYYLVEPQTLGEPADNVIPIPLYVVVGISIVLFGLIIAVILQIRKQYRVRAAKKGFVLP